LTKTVWVTEHFTNRGFELWRIGASEDLSHGEIEILDGVMDE